jgi:hypothetical protein
VAAALDGFESRGRELNERQRALVAAFATDTNLLVAGFGPAGSGKTAAMRAYVHIASQAGQRVIPLATSAAAASVLGADLGAPAENLHKFLWEHLEGPYAGALRSGGQVPRKCAGLVLRPGDVVLLDEAGMAGTLNLDRLVTIAAAHGATVRMIGDWRQLGAVEAGGALRRIAHEVGGVELAELHRFANAAEGVATLKIRVGDSTGLDFYESEDRIRSGSRQAMIDAAYSGWQADMCAGKTTVMAASAGADVVALSAQARADRIAAGQVEVDGVQLRDGNLAGRGDWIVTRHNDRRLMTARGKDFVKNGDAWTVVDRRRDGSLKVERIGGKGRIALPADYVRQHVELLYACTAMRIQGATVDTAHPLITPELNREALYVMLSRAREHTTLYVATHELLPFDTDDQLDAPSNDSAGYAAREVLENTLLREGAELSASDSIRALQEKAASLSTLAPRYQHAADVLTADHYKTLIENTLPAAMAGRIVTDPAFSAVVRALRGGEAAFWQPQRLLLDAVRQGDLADADSPARLLAWRMNTLTDQRSTPAHLAAPTAADAARYATLIGPVTSPGAALDVRTALETPAALRLDAARVDTHPRVPVATLNRYAGAVADALGIDAEQVAAHRAWFHLAGTLYAADRAGRDLTALVASAARTAITSGEDTDQVARLARTGRALLAADGIPADRHHVPAALRHVHTAVVALGIEAAIAARREPSWPALSAVLRRIETTGVDPTDVLRHAAEQRPLNGVDSISRTLAWRLNQHLAANTTTITAERTERREHAAWNDIAWMLKAAENTGHSAADLLSGAGTIRDLTELVQHVNRQQLARIQNTEASPTLPPWLTATATPATMPADHADYLKASAELIADRFRTLGEQTTATRPNWTAALGQSPDDPIARARWQHQIAVIAAYRDQYGITDNNPDTPAGPYIEAGRAGHGAWWHAAEAALTARHIAAAPTHKHSGSTTDAAARRQLAADLCRALPEHVQTQILHTIADRTGNPWLKDAVVLGDDALTKPSIAEHLIRAMSDHGHMPGEAAKAEQRNTMSLDERRRATREAERQARREQILARRTRPGSQNIRVEQSRRAQPMYRADAAQPRHEQVAQPMPTLLQPPSQQPDQQGPRLAP